MDFDSNNILRNSKSLMRCGYNFKKACDIKSMWFSKEYMTLVPVNEQIKIYLIEIVANTAKLIIKGSIIVSWSAKCISGIGRHIYNDATY